MPALRVMTWNVHRLRDDRDAVVATLREAGPDVVALQEPPRGPLGRRRLAGLAREAGLRVAVAGGGARTTALLVRPDLPVSGRRTMRLPVRPGRTRRGLAYADVAAFRVMSLHLGLSGTERARHLIRVLHLVRAAPGPVVVAGDLNEEPGGPSWRRLALHLRDVTTHVGPTFPAGGPRRRIDAVLAAPGVEASGAHRVDDDVARRASDHLPVVVDVRAR